MESITPPAGDASATPGPPCPTTANGGSGGTAPEVTWSALPDELCTHVFSYLNPAELCTATLVCKQWSVLTWAEKRELSLKPFFGRMNDQVLLALLKKTPKLVKITIKSPAITDAVVDELVRRCPRIESLSIINATGLTPASVKRIAEGYAGKLTSLSMKGCHNAMSNDALVKSLTPLSSSLEHLNLEGCWRITDGGIKALSITCRKLKTIKLGGCYKLTARATKDLADNCLDLQNWKLGRQASITDVVVGYIAKQRGATLKRLDLSLCPVADEGVKAVFQHCPNLEELCVKHCRKLTSSAFLENIGSCCHLTVLDIQRVDVNNEAIQAILASCPKLRVINFKSSAFLDASVLATIPMHCPDVEVLRLYGNSIDKDLMINISRHCNRLHTLDLRRLELPFDDVKVIALDNSACKRSMRRLCIVEAALDRDQIAWLEEQFPLAKVLWQKKGSRS